MSNNTTIIRVPKTNNYSIISNGYINDERLSMKAKGILTYLLSKPDDWQVYPEHLKTVSKDGIKSVYSGLRELLEYGYMERHAYRDDKQRIIRWEYTIIESPMNNCVKKSESSETPEDSLFPQKRQVGHRKVENGGILNTEKDKIQKTTTTDSKMQSPLLSPNNATKKSFESQEDTLQKDHEGTPTGIDKTSDQNDKIVINVQKTTSENMKETAATNNNVQPQLRSLPSLPKTTTKSFKPQENNIPKCLEAKSDVIGKMSDQNDKIVRNVQKNTSANNNAQPQPQSISPDEYKAEHDTLVSLIPEQMRRPVIINLIGKYHRTHGFGHVADCIVYTNQRPTRGGNDSWQAYRGYLSKGLAGQYEGISGLYASANNKEDRKKSERQKILESLRKKNFFVTNDGKKYEIDEEGFVLRFEYVDKTGKKRKTFLIPSQIADIVLAGKATLE